MRALFVTSEIYPYVKTGGLGDVAAALPVALAEAGVDIRLLLPGYPAVTQQLTKVTTLRRFPRFFGASDAALLLGTLPNGLRSYVIDAPQLYNRPASPYTDPSGKDWADNHLRFAALGRIAANIGHYERNWDPDIIHGHDWQAGLAPAYVAWHGAPRPGTVITIHNLAFQGLFPRQTLSELGLPPESFSVNGLEYYDKVGFLKAGLYYADQITTVSPTYAAEIRTPEYGAGLDGLLRGKARQLTGILNGIDQQMWDPKTDKDIARNYDARSLAAKQENKAALIKEFGLAPSALESPLFAVVSRLTHQKGLDLLLEAAPPLLEKGLHLVVLGNGDRAIEEDFTKLAKKYPGRVGIYIGYDEAMAHRLQAGADAVLVPSRFEPCGLVQMYALRYGTLPIVRRTGGLADSVADAKLEGRKMTGTGFLFDEATPEAFAACLARAMAVYKTPAHWQALQKNAMAEDFGWAKAALKYLDVYKAAAPEAKAPKTAKTKPAAKAARPAATKAATELKARKPS